MPAKRPLGSSGLSVPPLCFGGNVLGWTADQPTSFQLLDTLLGRGFNFIDTADVYSRWAPGHAGGESETILGQWMKERNNRSRLLIATKVGMEMGPDRKGLAKDYILRAAEDSLRRLQTDYIDLYQAHKDDADTPLDETLAAFDQLLQQGKVRAIGASNYSAERLAHAQQVAHADNLPRYTTLQPEYNLYDRVGFESQLLPFCQKHDLAVIPYFSLAAGFLTGKYRTEADLSKSPRGQGIGRKYLNPRGMTILAALDDVSARTGATLAQISLAWLTTRPAVVAPIASATSLQQLEQLLAATELRLDHDSLRRLEQASD